MSDLRIRSFDSRLDTSGFDCGVDVLNEYIQRYASQDVRREVARVFVSTATDSQKLAGYFSLSAGSVHCSELPLKALRGLPRYPVPVAMLGRLAVDESFRGQGLGAILLADACQKVIQASQVLAVVGLIVDAKDDRAAPFYRHFGFQDLHGRTDRLLLPIKNFPIKATD